MASQGMLAPATQSGAWVNPGNAATVNGISASINGSTAVLTLSDYGFTIPTLAVINGIEIEITSCQNAGLAEPDWTLRTQLALAGVPVGTPQDIASILPLASNVYGSPTELWGRVWTAAEINAIQVKTWLLANTYANDALCDCIRLKVYYTETVGATVIGFIQARVRQVGRAIPGTRR